jgi:hypothetical protein
MKKILVTRKELGGEYPFTVDPVFLEKDKIGGLYVVHKKQKYNLNGVARKGIDIDSIWSDSPIILGTKKPLGVIFNICRERGLLK